MAGEAAGQLAEAGVGERLRLWRERRRMSQLALSLEAGLSQRHLSCLERGIARPSAAMVGRLAGSLRLPLRERNALLVAAGHAPAHAVLAPEAAPFRPALAAIQRILDAHAPNPAIAVDRHWTLLAMNAATAALLGGVDPALLAPPVNVLRLALHPQGLAPRIVNHADWRAHVLDRLEAEAAASFDAAPTLALLAELSGYPRPPGARPPGAARRDYAGLALPLELRNADGGVDSYLTMTTVFGTATEVTLSEVTIETFLKV